MKIAYLLSAVSRKAGGLFDACRRLAQTSGPHQISVVGVEDEFTSEDLAGWRPLCPVTFPTTGAKTFGYAKGYLEHVYGLAPDIVHVHGLWTYSSLVGYRWHRR